MVAGLVASAGLSRGSVVVVTTLGAVVVAEVPAEPAPRVATWSPVFVEPVTAEPVPAEPVPAGPVVAASMAVGAEPPAVVVGAAAWAVVVGVPLPPPVAISGITTAAATITAPTREATTTRERRGRGLEPTTSCDVWRGW